MKIIVKLVITGICAFFINKMDAQNFNFVPSIYTNYYYQPQNLGVSTPQVSEFMKYGNLNVNFYNGLLDLNIELDGYKDQDFDLPISLKYISSGFIPSKRPTLVGKDWILNVGGVINRVVKGSPDDTRGFYTGTDNLKYMTDGILVAIRDNKFKIYTESQLSTFSMEKNSYQVNSPYIWGDYKYDFEPDIFNFNFGKYSGSFIIDNNGEPKLLSENGCKIEIYNLAIQSYSTTDVPVNSSISITTPDGYIYNFGGNSSFLEYFIPNNPSNCKIVPRFITSWMLNTIIAPNRRTVSYSYLSTLQKSKYNYIAYSKFQIASATTYSDGSVSQNQTDVIDNSKNFAMEDKIYTPIINNIVIDNNTTITFNKLKLENGFYDILDADDHSTYLSSITMTNNNTPIKTTIFEYKNSGNYFFLESINRNNSKYIFSYNFKVTLPEPMTTSLDHWGFWAGGYETVIDDVNSYCLSINNTKEVNPLVCDVALLDTIVYPSGGKSVIEYENNRYNNYFERDMSKIQLNLVSLNESNACGGARVKSIYDFDPYANKYSNKRDIYYKESLTGIERGVINLKPKYRIDDVITSYTGGVTFINGNPMYYTTGFITATTDISFSNLDYNSLLQEYHVSYPNIIVQNSDNSYVKYHYSSLLDVSDDVNINYPVTSDSRSNLGLFQFLDKHGTYLLNDMSRFRGKLLSKTLCSSSNEKVVETNKYNIEDAKLTYNLSIKSTPLSTVAYKIYFTPCRLIEQKTDDQKNGITSTINYIYNSKNFISEKTTLNSNNLGVSVKYKYPCDFVNLPKYGRDSHPITEMQNYNEINYPIEEKTIVNGKITDVVFTEFYKIGGRGLEHRKPTSIYKLNITSPIADYSDIIFNTSGSAYTVDSRMSLEANFTYYSKGNICERISNKSGVTTTYLWSYNGQCLVAEIKNATCAQVSAALQGITPEQLILSTCPDMTKVDALRSVLPNSLITTYTYKPLVGMVSKTDPRGVTTNYTYDTFNRLYLARDNNKNIVGKYNYAYQNQTTANNTNGGYAPISASIQFSSSSYLYGATGTASLTVSGGTGNYTYNWYVKDNAGNVLTSTLNTTATTYSFTCNQTTLITVQCVITDAQTGSTFSTSRNISPICFTYFTQTSRTASNFFYNIAQSIIKNSTTVSGYLLFYSDNIMNVGTSYLIGNFSPGLRPTVTQTMSYDTSGRTLQLTFNPDGSMYVKIVSGTAIPAYQTINIGQFSFNLYDELP